MRELAFRARRTGREVARLRIGIRRRRVRRSSLQARRVGKPTPAAHRQPEVTGRAAGPAGRGRGCTGFAVPEAPRPGTVTGRVLWRRSQIVAWQRRAQTTRRRTAPATTPAMRTIARHLCSTRSLAGRGPAIGDPRFPVGRRSAGRSVIARCRNGVRARRRVDVAGRMPPPSPPAAVRLVARRGIALQRGLSCGARRRAIGGRHCGRVQTDPVYRGIRGGGRRWGRFLGQHFGAHEPDMRHDIIDR